MHLRNFTTFQFYDVTISSPWDLPSYGKKSQKLYLLKKVILHSKIFWQSPRLEIASGDLWVFLCMKKKEVGGFLHDFSFFQRSET